MGNNPVSNVDLDGGLNIPVFADLGSDFLNAAGNSLIGGAIGYGIGRLAGGKEGGKWGAAIGFGVVAGSYVPWKDVGHWAEGLFQGGRNELLFKSIVETAIHWGKAYNDNSIVEKKEYGSTIYEVVKKKKTYYQYSIPNRATNRGSTVPVSKAPFGKTIVADIHSHGNSWGEHPGEVHADNSFSTKDKWSNYNKKIDGYLTTPNGSLIKYDYKLAKEILISTDMPSDPRYPKLRKNSIDPFVLPKNEPSIPYYVR